MQIRPGMKLRVARSDCFALAGPVITDRTGNLLVLAPCSLLLLGSSLEARDGKHPIRVGERPGAFFTEDDSPNSATTLLGWFRPELQIDASAGSTWPSIEESMASILGSAVVVDRSSGAASGYVCAMEESARFKLPNRTAPAAIHGLLRITADEQSRPLAGPGVAGTTVTLEGGALLGLVVGTLEGDVLVAPLNRLFGLEAMKLATLRDIKRHNEAVERQARRPPEPIEAILDAVAADHGNWQSGIVDWILTGWQKLRTGAPKAFFPYSPFFAAVEDLNGLELRLWEFRWSYLSLESFDEVDWAVILRQAYNRLDLSERASPRHKIIVGSSYDLVMRRSNDA